MAILVNFAFLVPHAMINGLTKFVFSDSSAGAPLVSKEGMRDHRNVRSETAASEILPSCFKSSTDFSAAWKFCC